jgi:hypothetical protein
VINWCAEFHRWKFEIAVVERTDQTKDRVMILLRMEDDVVSHSHLILTSSS